MKSTKACGCMIGAAIVELEKAKRKHIIQVEGIEKKIKKTKSKKNMAIFLREKKQLMEIIAQKKYHKKNLKRAFHDYIKKSGYKPPKN